MKNPYIYVKSTQNGTRSTDGLSPAQCRPQGIGATFFQKAKLLRIMKFSYPSDEILSEIKTASLLMLWIEETPEN
ncbi:MAG: hypothetical protein CV087_21320 [Candidatus Brocadia sp. WS118]|nr:MAG: hypothetical protein CV087_21320 [Candidatus Brocadia sp. WS118]